MELKRTYTEAEVADLLSWFEERTARLPKELQLNKASFIPDLNKTIKAFASLAVENRKNATFGGQIKLFFEIREKLQEQGID